MVVFDVVESGGKVVLRAFLAVFAALLGVSPWPVDECGTVEEAEARLIGRGAEAVRARLRQANPAAIDADEVVGIAEGIVAVADVRAVAGAVRSGGLLHEGGKFIDGLGIVGVARAAHCGEHEARARDPSAGGGAGVGRASARAGIDDGAHGVRCGIGLAEVDEEDARRPGAAETDERLASGRMEGDLVRHRVSGFVEDAIVGAVCAGNAGVDDAHGRDVNAAASAACHLDHRAMGPAGGVPILGSRQGRGRCRGRGHDES